MTPASGPGAVITWLGHASVVLDLDGVRLLTDPLLGGNAGLLRRRPGQPDSDAWADPAVVLLSHLHHDHAEPASLRRLGPVPVLTAPANARWLHRHGLGAPAGPTADGWWRLPAPDGGEVSVRLVPAVHGGRPMPHRPNAANGFLVVAPSTAVWFAGDTAPYPAMGALPELAGRPVDVALVPVGGWGPRLSAGHMDPVQAAEACAVVGARVAIPVHWGTLHAPASSRLPPGWMDRAGPAFAAALRRRAPRCHAAVLAPGERLRVA